MNIKALEAAEAHTEELLAQHRFSTRLVGEIQGENAGLTRLFYELSSGVPADRKGLLVRLDTIERQVLNTLEAARNEASADSWKDARVAVNQFITQARGFLVSTSKEAPESLYRAHEELIFALSRLVLANYETAIEQDNSEAAEHRRKVMQALLLLVAALGLAVVCAVTTVRVTLRIFQQTARQARELSRLSGHVLDAQEIMIQNFSRELHDEFGQSLTAIEANLAAIPSDSPEVAARVEDCSLLVKDLITSVREFSQVLRPSMLDDFGLRPSLQWLAESFAQRTGINVDLRTEFEGRLGGETETHLYRIAQEALTNVARHSGATSVQISLEKSRGMVRLTVADNGKGFPRAPEEGRKGLGLAGMRERMRVAGGTLNVRSDSKGAAIVAEVKLDEATRREQANPSFVGG